LKLKIQKFLLNLITNKTLTFLGEDLLEWI
jgi:hypothetical protein